MLDCLFTAFEWFISMHRPAIQEIKMIIADKLERFFRVVEIRDK